MSRTGTLILLGTLIILMPLSGLPVAYRTFFSILFGAGVLVIGLSLRTHEVHHPEVGVEFE